MFPVYTGRSSSCVPLPPESLFLVESLHSLPQVPFWGESGRASTASLADILQEENTLQVEQSGASIAALTFCSCDSIGLPLGAAAYGNYFHQLKENDRKQKQ